jgi:hypothetical protein
MEHDPLCPKSWPGGVVAPYCYCDLIAKVEARQLEDTGLTYRAGDEAGYRRGYSAGLDAAAEAVRGMLPFACRVSAGRCPRCASRKKSIAAIYALLVKEGS